MALIKTVHCVFSLLFLVVFVCTPVHNKAQSPDPGLYTIRHYTDADGLPQNSVKSIVPDQNDFVWLATEFGLTRFDGHNFQTFRNDTGSLLDSRFVYILPTGIPFRYYAVTGTKQLVRVNETTAPVPTHSVQQNIHFKGHLTREPYTVYTTIGLPNIFRKAVPANYYGIPLDSASYYLIGQDSISFYYNNSKQYALFFSSGRSMNFFTVDSQLYFQNAAGEILSLQQDAIKKVSITGDLLNNTAWPSQRHRLQLFWNLVAKQVFFALNNSVYFVKQLPGGQLHTKEVLAGFDMEENKIMSAWYEPSSGQLFLGSLTKGLFIGERNKFAVVQSAANTDEFYYAQAPFDAHSVATPQGAVIGTTTRERKLPALQALMSEDRYSMLIAHNKEIWIKNSRSLFCFNPDGTILLNRWEFRNAINVLFEDSSRRIWMGTSGGEFYSIAPGMQEPALVVKDLKESTTCMQQQDADLYWIGTDKGCYRFRFSTRTLDTIAGIKGKYVRSLYVRGNDETWITTYEEGFFLHNGQQLISMPVDKYKYLLSAHCILEDQQGFFWISTNKGLFQASRADLLNFAGRRQRDVIYHYYEKSSGFSTNEFNGGCQPCGVKLASGFFSFPSMNGLVWFKPDSIHIAMPDKALFVDKIEINRAIIHATDTIRPEDATQRMRFYISTPYFGNARNLFIDYALLQPGEDSAWLPIDADKTITLSALSSGTYHLVIRKSNGFGKDNYAWKVLTIIVPPFFYETWWFRSLMALSILLLVWAYSAIRLRYIQRKNRLLEERIADRTKELEQTLTALQDSEQDLRQQTRLHEKLITAIAHDIKSPLKFMTDAAKRIAHNLQQAGQPEDQEQAQALFESGARVYYYTESLLEYIKLQTRNHHISTKPLNLHDLVAEKTSVFQTIAHAQGSQILNEVPRDLFLNSNTNLLGVVIHNLLDNAVKVTINGTIRLTATLQEDRYILTITDTGAGMQPVLVSWCNETTDSNTEQAAQAPGHTGMGLLIVKSLLAHIHGRLFVERAEPRGTIVQVIISR